MARNAQNVSKSPGLRVDKFWGSGSSLDPFDGLGGVRTGGTYATQSYSKGLMVSTCRVQVQCIRQLSSEADNFFRAIKSILVTAYKQRTWVATAKPAVPWQGCTSIEQS